jgi:putative transposase
MAYNTGSHSIFHDRYHIVWAPNYRFKVLHGAVRLRVRESFKQVCAEMDVAVISGVLSADHVHMFVEIPLKIAVSDFVRHVKGRSLRKIQQEFEHIRKRYWGQLFWARGYFSTNSGNIADTVILTYLNKHIEAPPGFSPSPLTYRRQPVFHSVSDFCNGFIERGNHHTKFSKNHMIYYRPSIWQSC